MFKKNVSGQRVYFAMVGVLSGYPVASGGLGSLSGKISGYVSVDGGAIGGVGGFITEDGFGQYHLNGYAADFNGDNIGYYFTTGSGVIPVSISVVTIGGISGSLWFGSGQSVNVYSGQLSGQPVTAFTVSDKSGYTATPLSGTVYIASGPFTVASLNSGQLVIPYSGQLSGQLVNLLSGNQVGVWSGTSVNTFSGQLSGQQINANLTTWLGVAPNALLASGRVDAAFNVRTNVARSGTATTLQLDAGAPTGTSGIYDGALLTIVGGSGAGESRIIKNYGSSGIAFVEPAWTVAAFADSIFTITPEGRLSGTTYLASGVSTLVYSGQLSGQPVTAFTVSDKSGYTATPLSGTVYIASGPFTVASLNSGQLVIPYSGQLSGQQVNLLSGNQTAVVSGTNVNTWSGQTQIASGPYVQATATVGSGVLFLAPDSIFRATFASGVLAASGGIATSWGNSGAVTVGQNLDKSGYTATPLSGTTYIASGPFVQATAVVGSGQLFLAPDSIFRATFASGVLAASGGIATAWGDSGSVTVGQNLDKSGYTAGTLSGTVYIASGPFVQATATVGSGTLFLAPDSIFRATFASGVLAASGGITTAWGNSGAGSLGQNLDKSGYTASLLSGQAWIASGQFMNVYSGQLSGQRVNLLSGNTIEVLSGTNVNTWSGQTRIASGPFTVASLNSGQLVIPYSGQLSGQQVNLLSGNTIEVLSGTNVNTWSGQTQIASGPYVQANASVPSGTLFLASGNIVALFSGQSVITAINQDKSGYTVGASLDKSGYTIGTNLDKSGYTPVSGMSYLASGMIAVEIPKAVITYDFSGAPNVSGIRCVLNAERKLINRWDAGTQNSGYLTVYREDDSTEAYKQAITATSGASPITQLDTN